MKALTNAIITLPIMLLFFTATFASGGDAYKCELRQVLSMSKEGKLLEADYSAQMIRVNKEFVVDRSTGRIIGGKGISNYNAFGEPRVLDYGSSEQAFKVLTIYSPYRNVSYLEIQEFESSHDKPFIYFDLGDVYSGLCRHY